MRLCCLRCLVFLGLLCGSVATKWPQWPETELRNQDICDSIPWTSRAPDTSDKWMLIDQPAGTPLSSQRLTELRHHVLSELQTTLNVLQDTWFDLSSGTWIGSIDWTGAVLNTHLVAALQSLLSAGELDEYTGQAGYNDTIDHYFMHNTAYYFGERADRLRREAYDDMLWVVLGWQESIRFVAAKSQQCCGDNTSWYGSQFVPVYARRARSFYNLTTNGWSTQLCGGGMTWNPRLQPYKNAITNQLYIAASVGYSLLPSTSPSQRRFLDSAIAGYDWLQQSRMTNDHGLYVDGFHISNLTRNGTVCNEKNEMVYTYNQGVILSGLRGLWEATQNSTYLHDGHSLIRKTIAATGWDLAHARPANDSSWNGLGRRGIMEDYCDASASCDQNNHAFKSIYFHHLGLFCKSTQSVSWHRRQCARYIPWVMHNARAALATRDPRGRIGNWWGACGHGRDTRVSLPLGAVDYRNDPSMLSSRTWSGLTQVSQQKPPGRRKLPVHQQDVNDRGRGRTVESHAGGLAVLWCLLQLLDARGD